MVRRDRKNNKEGDQGRKKNDRKGDERRGRRNVIKSKSEGEGEERQDKSIRRHGKGKSNSKLQMDRGGDRG